MSEQQVHAAQRPDHTALAVALSVLWAGCYVVGYHFAHVTGALLGASVVVLTVLYHRGALAPISAQRSAFWRGGALGLGVGTVSAVLTWVLLPALTDVFPVVGEEIGEVRARAGATWVWVPAVAVIALTEEVLWREVLQRSLAQRFAPALGIGLSAGVYALAQSPVQAWSVIVVALCFGALWGAMRYWTGALWASMIAHMIWTLSQVVMPLVQA